MVDVAAEYMQGEVVLEWEQSHGREVVQNNYCQGEKDHLKGSDGVHLVAAQPKLPQGPQDGDVTE